MVRRVILGIIVGAVWIATSGVTAEASGRVGASTKGSVLIYSKVDLRWGPGGQLRQDTIIEITNDYPEDVYVQMYFVNGDEPREPIFALDPPILVAGAEPGWNWVDCQSLLTANQPSYWSAATGSPFGCQPFTILDPDIGQGPGRLDPESSDGGRVLRGYVIAWAVNAQGEQINWNHLSGAATIVHYGAQAAWEYNAWAFQETEFPRGEVAGSPGILSFGSGGYEYGFDTLLMDFYASGSQAFSRGGITVSVDTDLTLHPISVDLRQDNEGPITTKAHFDIWNGNEQRFSGTHRCITCWDQTLLSNYDAPNHFLLAFLGTDKGKARIDGQASNVCDRFCGQIGDISVGVVCSEDAALLGVVSRVLEFSGTVLGRRAMSGRSLVGAGTQSAEILYDIIDPPGTLRDDAREAIGLIRSDGSTRIRGAKGTSDRSGASRNVELQSVQE